MGKKSQPTIVGIARAAEITGLSESYIRLKCQNGELPCERLSVRAIAIAVADLAKIERKRQPGGGRKKNSEKSENNS